MNKNIVLLGATSFIATNFIKNYRKNKIKAVTRKIQNYHNNTSNITWLECDLNSKKDLLEVIDEDDIVINCAYSKDGIKENLNITRNLIECCNIKNIDKLIHFSTAVVTGVQDYVIIDEEAICNPITNYQKDKLQIESCFLDSVLNFNLIILRPTAVFGMDGKNLIKNINSAKNSSFIINFFKMITLGNRHMHLVSVENVINTMDFFIDDNSNIKIEIFFISQDNDSFNYYKNVYPMILEHLNKFSFSYISNLAIPKYFLTYLLMFFNKRYEEVSCVYSPERLKIRGVSFENSLEDSIKRYLEKIDLH